MRLAPRGDDAPRHGQAPYHHQVLLGGGGGGNLGERVRDESRGPRLLRLVRLLHLAVVAMGVRASATRVRYLARRHHRPPQTARQGPVLLLRLRAPTVVVRILLLVVMVMVMLVLVLRCRPVLEVRDCAEVDAEVRSAGDGRREARPEVQLRHLESVKVQRDVGGQRGEHGYVNGRREKRSGDTVGGAYASKHPRVPPVKSTAGGVCAESIFRCACGTLLTVLGPWPRKVCKDARHASMMATSPPKPRRWCRASSSTRSTAKT